MKNSLIYFNRRGAVCALRKEYDVARLPRDQCEIHGSLSSLQARYFVVMKRIDKRLMLVAPVFSAKRKDSKSIWINGKRFWVGFMNFHVVPEDLFEAVPGKYLDHSFKTIADIYESHNNVLKSRKLQERKRRTMCQVKRRIRRKYCESERHRLAKQELQIHLA